MLCKICNFDSKSYRSLAYHISHTHKMSSEQYYIKYIKKSDEGICKYCGKLTSYLGLQDGYKDYCNKKCYCQSEAFKKRIIEDNFWNKADIHSIQQRNNKIASKKAEYKQYIINQLNGILVQNLIKEYGQLWYKHNVVNIKIYKTIAYIDNKDKQLIIDYYNNLKKFKSSYEYDIVKYLQSFYNKQIMHNIKINKREVDIYLPDLKLIIEYNGLYWHNMRENENDKYDMWKENGYDVYIITNINKLYNLKEYIKRKESNNK